MEKQLLLPVLALTLSACSAVPVWPPGDGHLQAEKVGVGSTADIPAPVRHIPPRLRPEAGATIETYSVVVNNVKVQELLFALARDAKLNVDIHPGIEGLVILNAIDQTLQQLLTRIARQVDVRWELDGPNLSVMPDKPFLRNYKIDFPNMSRSVKSALSTSTQIASATAAGASATSGGNTASTLVTSDTNNNLMESLISNVTDMLKEEDRIRYRAQIETEVGVRAVAEGSGTVSAGISTGSETRKPDGSVKTAGLGGSTAGSAEQTIDSRSAAKQKIGEYEPSVAVFANKETGVLIVRATSRQHEKIQAFIDQVMGVAKRQVLIEATIVEVSLGNDYKQGINWSLLRSGAKGFQVMQAASAGLPSSNPLNIFTFAYANPASRFGSLAAEISLLESFGDVRVISSPKLSVMNNQTATLKVADSKVFFTVKAETTDNNGISRTTFSTTPNSVSVGFVMNVTPQISDADEVTINIRPTITRITGFVNDPNPDLAKAGVVNQVPEIQTREMESIIKIGSGQIAVMGGLMQEESKNLSDAIPAASTLPLIGNLFRHVNDKRNKTELVIFLRPVVLKDASIHGAFSEYRSQLPGRDFFGKMPTGPPPVAMPTAQQPSHWPTPPHLLPPVPSEVSAGDYLRALEADPKDARAYAALTLLRPAADMQQDESRLKILLAEQPDSPDLHFALGNLYTRGARWAEAQQAFFRAHAVERGNPDYLFNLAVSLDQLHQPRLAAQYYRQALAAAVRQPAGFDSARIEARLQMLPASALP
jgi:MSHA biogenesis protein MshL